MKKYIPNINVLHYLHARPQQELMRVINESEEFHE